MGDTPRDLVVAVPDALEKDLPPLLSCVVSLSK
jgi:hypothetical protein